MTKAEEILRKHVEAKTNRLGEEQLTEDDWKEFMNDIGGNDVFIPAMIEFANYVLEENRLYQGPNELNS
jgi:hypothetical protein